MTTLSRAERRSVVERFYQQVSKDTKIDPDWMRRKIEASVPELPEDPTPEQCDAWIELASILDDPGFVDSMRSNVKGVWDTEAFDATAYERASEDLTVKASQAISAGFGPTSETGKALARELLETSARLMGREPNQDFKKWLHAQYTQHDPRASRYWELVAIMKGQSPQTSPNREWLWIASAMKHHLADQLTD